MNFEEMTNVAAQIKSCLNSRPLTAITSHLQDGLQVLKSSHFPIECPGCAYPELPIETSPSMHKKMEPMSGNRGPLLEKMVSRVSPTTTAAPEVVQTNH